MAGNEKTKKSKKLLWIGLGILGAGILLFGGLLSFGLITLARDMLFTAIVADVGLVGGVLGKKAVNAIADSISNRKAQKRELRRTRTTQLDEELSQQNVNSLEGVPTVTEVNQDRVNQNNSQTNTNETKQQNRSNSRK